MSGVASRMRITGTSGMDIQSMVSQLIKAESYKVDRAKQQLQILNWRQEIYRNTANEMRTFRDSYLSFSSMATNFKSTSMFKALKTFVTGADGKESTGISVTTGAATKPSTTTLKVLSLATKDSYASTGTSLAAKYESTGAIDYEKLKSGDAINVTLDGVTKKISLDFTDEQRASFNTGTPQGKADFDNFIKEQLQTKIDNTFGTSGGSTKLAVDVTGGKLSFTAATGHSFSVKEASGASYVTSLTGSTVSIKIGENTETLKADTDTTSLGTVGFKIKIGSEEKTISASGSTTKELIENLNKKIAEEYKDKYPDDGVPIKVGFDTSGKITFAMSAETKDLTISSDSGAETSLDKLGFSEGSISLSSAANTIFGRIDGGSATYKNKASIKEILGDDLFDSEGKFTMKINDTDITLKNTMTIDQMMSEINKSGAKMSFNSLNGTFAMEAAGTGETSKIELDSNAKEFLQAMGMTNNSKARLEDGSLDYSKLNALVEVNGVATTRFENKIVMDDGVNIAFDSTTKLNEVFTVKTNADTSKAVENIKKFVESYNKLLDGLNSQVNTARPQSDKYTYYDPLTDEQKDAMSDKEVEKWEEQAKKGLLRNDDTLGGIASKLRQWMSESVDLGDGNKINLRDIGISSSNWYDYGKLSIDEDKLVKALEERPDDVSALFTKSSDVTRFDKSNRTTRLRQEGLAERLDDIIDDAISSSSGSLVLKAGTLNTSSTHENYMSRAIKQQNELIERLMSQLNNKEERYYKMFSTMEAAMRKNESQQSWLSSQM